MPDARVGHLDPGAVGRGGDVDRDRAAARRELDRVGHEVGDDLADPLRVVADPDRGVGKVHRQADTAAGRGGARLLDGALDRRAQVVGSQVEQDQAGIELGQLEEVLGQPVEPLDLLAARFEELGARLGVVGGALAQELVERPQRGQRRPQLVRDVGQEVAAPVAVAADDLDALLEPVGHRVELDRQLGELGRTGPDLAGRHAPREVALGQAARRLGQAPQRRREPARHRGRHEHAQAEREERDRGQQAR